MTAVTVGKKTEKEVVVEHFGQKVIMTGNLRGQLETLLPLIGASLVRVTHNADGSITEKKMVELAGFAVKEGKEVALETTALLVGGTTCPTSQLYRPV